MQELYKLDEKENGKVAEDKELKEINEKLSQEVLQGEFSASNDMKLDDMRLLLFALFFVGRITLHCMHSLSGTILAVQWGKAKNAGASCSAVRDSEVIRLVLYLR